MLATHEFGKNAIAVPADKVIGHLDQTFVALRDGFIKSTTDLDRDFAAQQMSAFAAGLYDVPSYTIANFTSELTRYPELRTAFIAGLMRNMSISHAELSEKQGQATPVSMMVIGERRPRAFA